MNEWYIAIGVRTATGSHLALTRRETNCEVDPTNEDREELRAIAERAGRDILRVVERREAATRIAARG